MHFSFYFIKIGQILLEKEFFENRHFARYRDENADFFNKKIVSDVDEIKFEMQLLSLPFIKKIKMRKL